MKTCLSISCPERKSICCGMPSRSISDDEGTGFFVCAKCKKEFVGGECATGKKVDEWWEEKFKGPMGVRNKLGRFVKGGKPIAGFKKGNKPHNSENLVGQKFNRLMVLKNSGKRKNDCIIWECLCDCGNKSYVRTASLKSGQIKSCGCLKNEINKDRNGSKNPCWRGNKVGYNAAHRRVEKLKGKPKKCEVCNTTNKQKKYEWANLTGHYEDVNDYKRMCLSCHAKFDTKVLNLPNFGVTAWRNFGERYGHWEYFEKEVTKHTLLLVMNVLADKWDAIENQDPDQSEEKWRSYKGIRNNIRDTIKQIAKTKGIKI